VPKPPPRHPLKLKAPPRGPLKPLRNVPVEEEKWKEYEVLSPLSQDKKGKAAPDSFP